MRIIDIVNGPWAITPDMLREVQSIYATHLRGEKIDIAAVEASIGRKLDNSSNGSYVVDNVAVIPIHGVSGKRMNLLTQISGGVSTEVIGADYVNAMRDQSVKGIVLHIDSPGGTVAGSQQLADLMASYKGTKPVIACADGCMCSAAYWFGSVADSIKIADLTTTVGSIGVVASHMDISKKEEQAGVKTTEITAGEYKRAVSKYKPLSDEGRAILQADVDQIYELFVETVAANRDTTVADVLENMAGGRVFLGSKAIDAGLADGVSTLAECIDMIKEAKGNSLSGRAGVAVANNSKEQNMDIQQLKADHPDLVEAISAEAREGMVTAEELQMQIETARTEGAEAENQRISDVRAQSVPGHEELIEQLAFDGKSTGADAALAIVAAEQKKGAQAAADLEEEAPPVVPPAEDDGEGKKEMKRAAFDALDQADRRAFLSAGGKLID